MRTINKILSALLIAFILFSFSACGCKHEWQDATCTKPKTCSLCGATESEALGHAFEEATCTAPKMCRVCGETIGEALGHNYADGYCLTCGEKDPDYVDLDNYGFYDMQNTSVTLVSVDGYNSKYVYRNSSVGYTRDLDFKYRLENGYITKLEIWYPHAFLKDENVDISQIQGKSALKSTPYYTVSNDQISFGGETMIITERVRLSDDAVLLKCLKGDSEIWLIDEDQFTSVERVKTDKVNSSASDYYYTQTRYYY
ncbi:MAG: hypothetical protein PUF31_04000 [Oscillospiraceae bacterium]|nr:hypothetical protein [Oscillospiraceae bacterium]